MKNIILNFVFFSFFFSFMINGQNYSLDPTYGNSGKQYYPDANFYPIITHFENNSYYLVSSANKVLSLNYDGTINNNFGSNGSISFNNTNEYFYVKGSKFLNGYFYIFGTISYSNSNIDTDLFIVKFSLNGAFDSSFGINGILKHDLGTTNDELKDILFLDNGKIICVGNINNSTTTNQIFLSKYNSNGSIDYSFDTNGYKILQINNYSNCLGVKILNYQNNLLVVGGTSFKKIVPNQAFPESHNELILLNLDQNGIFINNFGLNGVHITPLTSQSDIGITEVLNSIFINNTDLFVSVDYASSFYNRYKILKKYNFANNNISNLCYLPYEYPSYSIDSNQKIYVSGADLCYSDCNRIFRLFRKNLDGTDDLSFNNIGKFEYNFSSNPSWALGSSSSYSYFIHNDGKIFIAGRKYQSVYDTFAPGINTLRITDEILSSPTNFINETIILPNPVENEIFIENIDQEKITEISIYDLTGKEVFSSNKFIERINVSNINHGVYLMKIKSDDSLTYKKFIKK